MSRQRFSLALILIFLVVLAACQPAATPTPTARPAATTAPTEEAVAEATEAATEAVAEATEAATDATAEATEEMATMEATEAMMATEAATEEMATMEMTAEMTAEVGSVIDVAEQAGDFTTLLAAIDAAGLTETLRGDGPFTVFAPTDAAFATLLDENSMDAGAMLAREDLADILMYHVAAGDVSSDDLESYRSTDNPDEIIIPTLLEGESLTITFEGDVVMVNGVATVTLTNVDASNGVIHVIDTVLMPPADEVEATEAAVEATEVVAATEVAVADATETPVEVAEGSTVTVAGDSDVVIGLAVGLSGEGIAPLGNDIQRGAELALEDRPTVMVGGTEFNVALDVQDDLCSADGGQAIANRFASDGSVVGVVGPMCSSACRAAAPIFDAADYTTVSPSCTAPDLTTAVTAASTARWFRMPSRARLPQTTFTTCWVFAALRPFTMAAPTAKVWSRL